MATHIKAQNQLKPLIGLRGKTLFENAESFFHLLKDTLIEPQIDDPKRIKELVLQTYTYLRDKINRSSLGYCIKQSLAGYSTANQISNEMGGLPYFHYIEHLAKNIDELLPNLIQELVEIKDKIFHLNNPQLILSAEQKTFDFLKKEAFFQFGKIPSHPFTPWLGLQNTTPVSSLAYEIASPVAFVSEGYKVYGIDHRLSPALTLASYIMENASLHPMIREQGGAYGCGATYQPMTGNFYFHSYRDPNILSTYLAFHEAIDHIMSKKLDPQLLHEAKFEFIQELDAPITPGYRAQTAYLYEKTGKTLEFRKDYKQRILDVTLDDIKNAVQEAFSNNHGNKVFASSRGLYEKEQNSLNQKGFDLKMMKIS
jgi:Zn-dependent M16 (insulinase) family peptidase